MDAPDTRVAVVTGANRGIGIEVARGLARAGLHVVCAARDGAAAERAAAALRADGGSARAAVLDVADQASVAAFAAALERDPGRVDVLVNNAGVYPAGRATHTDRELARETLETNALGAWALAVALAPLLRRSAAGRIVNVSSEAGSLASMTRRPRGVRRLQGGPERRHGAAGRRPARRRRAGEQRLPRLGAHGHGRPRGPAERRGGRGQRAVGGPAARPRPDRRLLPRRPPRPVVSRAAVPGAAPSATELRAARVSVVGAFGLHALAMGTLGPRVPALQEQTGAATGGLGIALSGLAVGLFVGTRLAGPADRVFGERRVLRAGMPLLALGLIAPALAGDLVALTAGLVLLGLASGLLDVAMNAAAVRVERGIGRPIMGSFHGVWSSGVLASGLIAAGAAALDAGPDVHFTAMAVLLVAVSLVALRRLLPPEPVAEDAHHGAIAAGLRSTPILLLGAIAFCALVAEGAAADWTAVFLRDTLEARESTAALGVAGFALGMTAGRFAADRIVAPLGPVLVVRAGGVLAAVAMGSALLAPSPAAAFPGFVLLGVALAAVVPVVFSAAGNVRNAPPGALGWVVTFGYVGSIVGPALIGVATHAVSLRAALLVPVGAGLVIAVLAGQAATGSAAGSTASRRRTHGTLVPSGTSGGPREWRATVGAPPSGLGSRPGRHPTPPHPRGRARRSLPPAGVASALRDPGEARAPPSPIGGRRARRDLYPRPGRWYVRTLPATVVERHAQARARPDWWPWFSAWWPRRLRPRSWCRTTSSGPPRVAGAPP